MRRALGVLVLLALTSGCSAAMINAYGDKAAAQTASVVAASHPDSGPGEVLVAIVSDEDDRAKVVPFSIEPGLLPFKTARVVPVTQKSGFLSNERFYARVELEREHGWEEVGEVDGFERPSSRVKWFLAPVVFPVALAFDIPLLPVYIWGAIFVKFVWPEHALGS